MQRDYAACIIMACTLSSTAFASATLEPGQGRQAFEVAAIKPNTLGYIDLGGGLRVLSGRTQCQAADTQPAPGDPLPPAGMGRCNVRNSTLKEIINVAYGVRLGATRAALNQIILGGPSWVETMPFDIEAKAENTATTTLQQMLLMLQTLLADRFNLRFHRETRDVSGFALLVSNNGPKLVAAKPEDAQSFTAAPIVKGQKMPVATIASFLSQRFGKIVVDKTGLSGQYNFTLTWTPDETELGPNGQPVARPPDQPGPSLMTALQEQLGLRLETTKVPMEVFVIDSVEMPSAN